MLHLIVKSVKVPLNEAVEKEFGGINILFNNAGVTVKKTV